MKEIIRVKRLTPYGVQLVDDSYRATTKAVLGFLQGWDFPMDFHIVDIVKDEKGREQISKIVPISQGAANGNAAVGQPLVNPVIHPDKFNNPERDKKIIRQSCLKAAVEYISSGKLTLPSDITHHEIICKLAEEFEKWVNRE